MGQPLQQPHTPLVSERFRVIGSNLAPSLKPEEARNLLMRLVPFLIGLELYTVETPKQEAPRKSSPFAQQRWEVKQARDWKGRCSRDEILAAGWVVKDSKDGFEVVLS